MPRLGSAASFFEGERPKIVHHPGAQQDSAPIPGRLPDVKRHPVDECNRQTSVMQSTVVRQTVGK